MGEAAQDKERRRSFRIEVDGTALLWRRREFAGRYPLADLSIGGCLIDPGPACELGQMFDVALHLGQDEVVRAPATVVRRGLAGGRRPRLGLRFNRRSPATEDCIHDLVLRNLEVPLAAQSGLVLLIGAEFGAGHPLVEAIGLLGHDAVVVTTPLDALWALESRGRQVHTVIVSGGIRADVCADLVRLLAQRYPRVRRIVAVDQPAEAPGLAADLVLGTPWDLSRLRRALPDREPPLGLRAQSA